jgi:hypothetical protein
LPPRISFIILNAITPFASNANNIKELIIYCPLHGKEKDREWFLACDIVPRIWRSNHGTSSFTETATRRAGLACLQIRSAMRFSEKGGR